MVYTGGVINDINRKETLEELQDNKLALVCHKLELKPTDTLLDIGCGWGTLAAYAAKNFDCDVTGVTLGKNQTAFGNKRIAENGVEPHKARILCKDYREIGTEKKFTKIVSLEMGEVSVEVRFSCSTARLTIVSPLSTSVFAATARSSAKSTTSLMMMVSLSTKSLDSALLGSTRTSSGKFPSRFGLLS